MNAIDIELTHASMTVDNDGWSRMWLHNVSEVSARYTPKAEPSEESRTGRNEHVSVRLVAGGVGDDRCHFVAFMDVKQARELRDALDEVLKPLAGPDIRFMNTGKWGASGWYSISEPDPRTLYGTESEARHAAADREVES